MTQRVSTRARLPSAIPWGLASWVLVGSLGCVFWPDPKPTTSRHPRKLKPDGIARTMVEEDVFLVVFPAKHEALVRRCTSAAGGHDGGVVDDCDVAWFVDGRLEHAYPATSRGAQSPTVVVEALAEPVAERIKRMDGRVLSVRSQDVQSGELPAVEAGAMYRFEVADDELTIVHRSSSEAQWVTRVAVVHVDPSVVVTSYLTRDQYDLFALQLRNGLAPATSTSWMVFEREGDGPGGEVWTIPSRSGEQGKVLTTTPTRVEWVRPRSPSELPEPSPPPVVQPIAPAEPAATPCVDERDCAAGQSCRTPEARLWNHCGPPREPSCAPGFMGDYCGHCFATCSTDADCPGQHCNGAMCESQAVCAVDTNPPP